MKLEQLFRVLWGDDKETRDNIFSSAGVQNDDMGKWPEFSKDICPYYACVSYPNLNCQRYHRQFFEPPLEYVDNLHKKIKVGPR